MVTTVLLDELGLLVHPLVVGSGMRLFAELSFGTALELVDSRTLGSGVLFLTYTPAGRGGGRQRVIRRPTVAIGSAHEALDRDPRLD